MIIVNELVRTQSRGKSHNYYGVNAINPSQKEIEKCSWACHNDTNFCKKNHVKFVKKHFETIDPIYFGIIKTLRRTGNYAWANTLFLVILMPLVMYWFVINSLDIQSEINQIKKA